jgi:hypothetical protein
METDNLDDCICKNECRIAFRTSILRNSITNEENTRKNDLMRCVTHREAVCGPEIHSTFDMRQSEVLLTCAWMWTVLYQLFRMQRNWARFYEMRESERTDTWGLYFLTCDAAQCGRARRIIPLVLYFLHLELWISGEPELLPLVMSFLHIKLQIVGEPGLMRQVMYCLRTELSPES